MLATVTLWTITVYLCLRHKPYVITLLPAMFMTMVTGCFLFVAEKEGLGSFIPRWLGYTIGAVITLGATCLFAIWAKKHKGAAEE